MTKLFFGLLFISLTYSVKGQQNQAIKVALQDTAQLRVLRTYITESLTKSGFNKDNSVLMLINQYDLIRPGRPQQLIGATGRKDFILDHPPTLISEIDGFRIAIWFGSTNDRFMSYSPTHLNEVSAFLLPGLADKPPFTEETFDINKPDGTINRQTIAKDPRPSERYAIWKAVYPEKGAASWQLVERGAVVDRPQLIRSEIVKPSK